MIAIRPVVRTTAQLVVAMAGMMLVPMAVDLWHGNANGRVFALSSALLAVAGGLVATATRARTAEALSIEQAFLLTAMIWIVLPVAGALPFVLGAPHASPLDALFESMSGMSTTGATVFPNLDSLPPGANLWRAVLHWMGGLGIVVVAMLFLPAMRVGGMQFFRSEGFDTMGKALPRARDMAAELTGLYIALTLAATLAFMACGLSGYDALFHAMSASATGGFSNYDASFNAFGPAAQWVGVAVMTLASVPFIRMVQLVHGHPTPILRDPQVRAYLRWMALVAAAIALYRMQRVDEVASVSSIWREAVFMTVSIFSGTGLGVGDMTAWGAFPFALLIMAGLIGGCTGSTGCSIKVFRWQVLWEAVKAQIRRMRSPSRVLRMRYDGAVLEADVVESVVAFFTLFILSLGLLIVGLSLTGLHPRTALTAAWTSICNVGPVFGPEVGATGSVEGLPAGARALMILGMYMGRLEIITVLVLLLPRFWWNQRAARPLVAP